MISAADAFLNSARPHCSSSFNPLATRLPFSPRLANGVDGIPVPKTSLSLTNDSNDNTETGASRPDIVADSIRRRQLVFSLLAASGATAAKPVRAEETNDPKAEITVRSADGTPVKIMKPPLDDREFATYILGNGLRVLLCSDPSTNSAGVAMDVHVGACSDPDDVPGLAHFCEHMLFLGTEKYPIEDSFETFLSSNGGSSNAFTDNENTGTPGKTSCSLCRFVC